MEEENDIAISDIPVIDAHVHFWEYEKAMNTWIGSNMKILREDYLPPQLLSTMKRNGVHGCVAIQARQAEIETFFLVELAKSFPFIRAVVGWVDLASPDVANRLEFFSQHSSIVGWRHIAQDEPAGFFARQDFRNGLSKLQQYNYTFDLLVYPQQLKDAIHLVAAFPEQRFVLDHCGKPVISRKEITEWEVDIKQLASHPNVCCKLSGLFTEARWKEWSAADFYPYFDTVFEAFSPQRLLFGSDWPVMLVSGIYVQWKSLVEKYTEHFSSEDRAAIFGGNAIKFYQR